MSIDKYILDRSNTALLVVDIQERLLAAMEKADQEMVIKNSIILTEIASEMKVPVLVSEQYRKGLGVTVLPLAEKLAGVETLEKLHFDCMRDEVIGKKLTSLQKETIIITGIEAHVCVLQSALSIMKQGMNAVVAGDAVASRRQRDRDMALKALTDAGAVVYPAETIAFLLLEKAGTPEFKKLSPLFK